MKSETIINGKAIYTPKGAAFEYGRIGCNFYTGCPHECSYCYLKRGAPSRHLGGNEVRLKRCFKGQYDALDIFEKEVKEHCEQLRETGVFFSFTTDPLIPETRILTFRAVRILFSLGIQSYILTKNAGFYESYPFEKYMLSLPLFNRKQIHFGFTLTGCDYYEQKADSNYSRIETMQELKFYGFSTWASIEPVIDWSLSKEMIMLSIPFCEHYKIGLHSGVKHEYYDVQDTVKKLNDIVESITAYGRTVYLKQSVRRYLQKYAQVPSEDVYSLLAKTVGIDGKPLLNI